MKIEQVHIDKIKSAFVKMQAKRDFHILLNEANVLLYGDKAFEFKRKQLTWYANPLLAKKRYTAFKIEKKSGAERSINAPVEGLRNIQRTLSFVLQCVYEPHKAAMGFVRDRSIVDNAKLHVGNTYVYNIDLKDFFSSVDQARIFAVLQLTPFNLNDAQSITAEELEYIGSKNEEEPSESSVIIRKLLKHNTATEIKRKYLSKLEIAHLIANLCCTEMEVERWKDGEWKKEKRKVLPQGAPTSPVLTNIICQRLDYLLTAVAKRFGLRYSRYADDITFSSMHNVYQEGSEFINELHRIIEQQNFHIKESKTRLQKDGYRKEVTGLLVNEKVNVQQRYIKQLRMWLYYWEQYGYERASQFFVKQYVADKTEVKGKPDMVNVIRGKLDYLKMVRGEEDSLYLKLIQRFSKLSTKGNIYDQILLIWEADGIEAAMKLFYDNQ